MNRTSNIERLGVNAAEAIVIKDLGWIFREQPIQDVGIDALIEEAEDGDPKGRFIAVQIKSGEGNFHVSKDKLTYYASHIHYNYWLKLEMPIILVAHIPEIDKTYWQEVNSKTFIQTKKKWKIEISFQQQLNSRSKDKLLSILSSPNDDNSTFRLLKGNLEIDTIDDIAEDTLLIRESSISLKKIIDNIESFRIITKDFTSRVNGFVSRGLPKSNNEVKASLKSYGKNLGICSRRLESEIILFSEMYAAGLWSYEQILLINNKISKNSIEVKESLSVIKKLPSGIDYAIEGLLSMRDAVSKLPQDEQILNKAKIHFLNTTDLIVEELSIAKEMTLKVSLKE